MTGKVEAPWVRHPDALPALGGYFDRNMKRAGNGFGTSNKGLLPPIYPFVCDAIKLYAHRRFTGRILQPPVNQELVDRLLSKITPHVEFRKIYVDRVMKPTSMQTSRLPQCAYQAKVTEWATENTRGNAAFRKGKGKTVENSRWIRLFSIVEAGGKSSYHRIVSHFYIVIIILYPHLFLCLSIFHSSTNIHILY